MDDKIPQQISRLERFQSSMEGVYGRFSEVSDPSDWNPPPTAGGHRGRYLWTDAFGVINFLTLHKELSSSGKVADDRYLIFAKRLVRAVHDILGRTRDGKSRLPRATDDEPLAGGLRIGKEEEHGPDGDGQYHHYLTEWMLALNRLSEATGDPSFNRQACSLGKSIHPYFFLDRNSAYPRMVWKVAMDLSRPLVASEGNLDPIDGYVVFRLVQASSIKYGDGMVLEEEVSDYKRVMSRKGRHFLSSDPLDLGMTLCSAQWLYNRESWATDIVKRCVELLRMMFEDEDYLQQSLLYRVAYREFGTCLGIDCFTDREPLSRELEDLRTCASVIINQWEKAQPAQIPDSLKPITRVMYSTALIPGAFKAGYFGPELLTGEN